MGSLCCNSFSAVTVIVLDGLRAAARQNGSERPLGASELGQ